jgi:RNA polymerase sigma-70 factor (ECF subfamily)
MKPMSHFDQFEAVRDDLFSIAYRMLGTIGDAEDVLQDAFIRWEQSDRENVRSTEAFLKTIVARLCIDRLRELASSREQYVGPWLPEPVDTSFEHNHDPQFAETISIAFLKVMESLSPVQRAVFLLHDVFDYDFNEIAEMVDESPANCRQHAKRARDYLAERRPRFEVVQPQHEELTHGFLAACQSGDLAGLQNLLARDVALYSDGGGKVTAARKPLHGIELVAKFLINVTSGADDSYSARFEMLNNQPAMLVEHNGEVVSAYIFAILAGVIQNIFVVRNPDKLARLNAIR